jgi:hypothetical protein
MNAAFQISLNIMQKCPATKILTFPQTFCAHGSFAFIDERRHLHHQRGRFAHNTPRMAWAYKNTEREKVGINCYPLIKNGRN